MTEIDQMDMLGFLQMRAWDAGQEQKKTTPKRRFIDDVWPMKP